MERKKRILVIGGGFSGIGAIKCLKEEGLEPICYEKTSQHGGTWRYREDTPPGLPSVMPSTVINHSKEMGALSNFVPRPSFANYMRHDQLMQMLDDVAEQFDCLRHMQCEQEVVRLERDTDYDATGRWKASVRDCRTGAVREEVFDGAVVGVGQFSVPRMPAPFEGQERYRGVILHSHQLKRVERYRGKRVLVVGAGASALDAAVELSGVAEKTFLSTRNGTWVLPRVGPFGIPFDYAMLRRFGAALHSLLGTKLMSKYIENKFISPHFNHNLYNLRPTYAALAKDPVTNDVLPFKLLTGAVQLRRNIKCFTEDGVIFENESKVTQVDVVVMSTGYDYGFPFLEEGIINAHEGGRIDLHKCVFPPHLKHPTLAVIGFILPWGPGFPLGEMQCRWMARVFSGNCHLPSQEIMMEDIHKRHKKNLARYAPCNKMSIKVDYIQYMDEIAEEIGTKPNLWTLLFTDFELFWALVFGPSLPYQYRLRGPNKWDGARKAILTAHKRMRYPLSGDAPTTPKKKDISKRVYFRYILAFLLVAFLLQQSENSVKGYLMMIMVPYFLSWAGFYRKYAFCLLMLPFFVPWSGFVKSYFVTVLVPMILAAV